MRRIARAILGAVLAVGAIGAARQARERYEVHRGRAAPVWPRTRVVAPSRAGPVARAVGGWLPARPTTLAGRVAVAVWAAPATAIGLVLAFAGGRRPVWDDEHGCLVATGVQGPLAWLLRAAGQGASTTGQVVTSPRSSVPPALLAHEAAHVRQFERLGPLAVLLYLWWSARFGYRQHPMERAAREAARRLTTPTAGPAPTPPASSRTP